MNISAAARATGLSEKTIRRYGSDGLLPNLQRRSNGYRTYSEEDIARLRFIRNARGLGFPVAVILKLLALRDDTGRKARDVRQIVLHQAGSIEQQAHALLGMAERLKGLVEECDGSDLPDCIILNRLWDGVDVDPIVAKRATPFEVAAVTMSA